MGKGEFAYYKLEFSDFETIKESMPADQGMTLLSAIVEYAKSGEVVDVPQEAKVFYAMLRKKQDRAKAKYEEKCQTNRDNASKGGKQKAMNAKARADGETSPKKFKAPTLSQFKNAVKKIVEINDFDDVEPYDVEKFYDELKENSWNFEGMAIQSRNDWEKIIHARFHDPLNYCHDGLRLSYLSILKGVIHAYPHLHHMWGEIDSKIEDLLDCWDGNCWKVNGNSYKQYDWKAALDALTEEQEEEEPP